jgi:predicted acyltransferase (DUF342 family)
MSYRLTEGERKHFAAIEDTELQIKRDTVNPEKLWLILKDGDKLGPESTHDPLINGATVIPLSRLHLTQSVYDNELKLKDYEYESLTEISDFGWKFRISGIFDTDDYLSKIQLIRINDTDYDSDNIYLGDDFTSRSDIVISGEVALEKLVKLAIKEDLNVGKNVDISGTLNVGGATTFKNLSVDGTLGVSGKTTLKDDLEVIKLAKVSGLQVDHNANISGNTSISGTLSVDKNATFASGVKITEGNLRVEEGDVEAENAFISGTINTDDLNASRKISGSSGIFDYLTVNQKSTLSGTTTIKGTNTLSGTTKISGNDIDISGTTVDIGSPTLILSGTTLDIKSITTNIKSETITLEDEVYISGESMNISGTTLDIGFDGSIVISGDAQFSDDLEIKETLSVSKDLTVGEDVTIEGVIDIVGNISTDGNLNVSGTSTLKGAVGITGLLTANAGANISGTTNLSGITNISGINGIYGTTTISGAANNITQNITIQNLKTPINDYDAATKKYVDDREAKLTREITAEIEVGGIFENQVLPKDMLFTDFVETLLTYSPPTISIVSITPQSSGPWVEGITTPFTATFEAERGTYPNYELFLYLGSKDPANQYYPYNYPNQLVSINGNTFVNIPLSSRDTKVIIEIKDTKKSSTAEGTFDGFEDPDNITLHDVSLTYSDTPPFILNKDTTSIAYFSAFIDDTSIDPDDWINLIVTRISDGERIYGVITKEGINNSTNREYRLTPDSIENINANGIGYQIKAILSPDGVEKGPAIVTTNGFVYTAPGLSDVSASPAIADPTKGDITSFEVTFKSVMNSGPYYVGVYSDNTLTGAPLGITGLLTADEPNGTININLSDNTTIYVAAVDATQSDKRTVLQIPISVFVDASNPVISNAIITYAGGAKIENKPIAIESFTITINGIENTDNIDSIEINDITNSLNPVSIPGTISPALSALAGNGIYTFTPSFNLEVKFNEIRYEIKVITESGEEATEVVETNDFVYEPLTVTIKGVNENSGNGGTIDQVFIAINENNHISSYDFNDIPGDITLTYDTNNQFSSSISITPAACNPDPTNTNGATHRLDFTGTIPFTQTIYLRVTVKDTKPGTPVSVDSNTFEVIKAASAKFIYHGINPLTWNRNRYLNDTGANLLTAILPVLNELNSLDISNIEYKGKNGTTPNYEFIHENSFSKLYIILIPTSENVIPSKILYSDDDGIGDFGMNPAIININNESYNLFANNVLVAGVSDISYYIAD